MNRTALIPLSLFLLVIIIATVVVSHYETDLTKNNNFNVEKNADDSMQGLMNHEELKRTALRVRKNIDLFEKGSLKPSLYLSMIKAKDLIAAGKFSEAKSALKTIIVFYPDNIEALSLLTGIYSMRGNYNFSFDLLNRILNIDPNNYVALENMGLVLLEMKQYKRALVSFSKASIIKPNSPTSYINMAKIYSITDEKKYAVENIVKAYRLLGSNIFPFILMPAFDNIRHLPSFIEIAEMARAEYKDNTNLNL